MVTFNPDLHSLKGVVESILGNRAALIIVDNGSENQKHIHAFCSHYKENLLFCPLDANEGIAAAQNVGIRKALEGNYQFIWLSDQDTVYEGDFADAMLGHYHDLPLESQETLAAIGPTFFDTTRQAIQPYVMFAPFTTKKMPEKGLNEAAHIIASGTFIPITALKKVGLKQENLFIDWVDMEWCWRATNLHHLHIYVSGDIQMTHTLGDSYVNVLGKKVIFRSPFRHYFMIRNAVSLALYSRSVAFFVRIELIVKALIWMCLLPVIAPENKTMHFVSTTVGFYHGLINRLGRYYKSKDMQ